MLRFNHRYFIALIVLLSALPAVAQNANFDSLTLALGFKRASVNGFTGGSHSFSEQFGSRDRNNNHCLGFGDTNPDHIMVLDSDIDKLTLQVNSGGNDTTLVVQGPNDSTLRCGDDSDTSKDARLQDFDWSAGIYKIWVGSLEPGQRWNYRLLVSEN